MYKMCYVEEIYDICYKEIEINNICYKELLNDFGKFNPNKY